LKEVNLRSNSMKQRFDWVNEWPASCVINCVGPG
jgi:hypothetical protein